MNKRNVKFVLDFIGATILFLPYIFRDKLINFLIPKQYADMPATCPIAILSIIGILTVVVCFIWFYGMLTDFIVTKIKDKES